jgi:thiol-disulfide isomerase/thioredoxin
MGGASKGPASMIGKTAPDLSLTLFDSSRLHLKDLRGSVVVLNFWASWCKPCREEMPVLQRVYDEYANSATSVVIVGVGTRTDNDPDARELVQTLGLTYPIGRDTNTDQPGLGPIEIAFGDPSAYPSTYFIRPDGVIDRIVVGPLSEEQLRGAIAEVAATDT